MNLPPIVGRWRQREATPSGGGDRLESVFDLKKDNIFQQRMLLILGIALLCLAVRIVWKPENSQQVLLADHCPDMSYGDQGGYFIGEQNKNGQVPTSDPPAEHRPDGYPDKTERSARTPGSPPDHGSRRTPIPAGRPGADNHASVVSQTAESAPAGQAAWGLSQLLDAIRNDPARELLDRDIESGDIEARFEEATQAGLIHFELVNKGQRTIFLPNVGAEKWPSQAFLERRVIEPDAKAQGVLALKGWPNAGRVTIWIGAANMKALRAYVEVPQWR